MPWDSMMARAFTGMKYVVASTKEEGDRVFVTGHIEGKHTGDLDLSAAGLGVVPASGKQIVFPEATEAWTIKGNQIASIQEIGENSGMAGFLAALGLNPPSG